MSKVRIVRGWLLCAAVSVAWLLWPSLPWIYLLAAVAPLFFMCCCAECSACDPDFGGQLQVEIAGIVQNSADCTCTDHNATYVLDFFADVAGTCTWVYDIDPNLCWNRGLTDVDTFEIQAAFGGAILEVYFRQGTGSPTVNAPSWIQSSVSTADCSAWVDESVPLFSTPVDDCQSDGTAALVTGL